MTNAYFWIIVAYCIIMVGLAIYRKEKNMTLDNFNVANRNLGWIESAFSIAATWTWAVALFVASEKAYVQGILGFFWFFVPNVLCLALFAFISYKAIDNIKHNEYSIAEMLGNIYDSRRIYYLHNAELLFLCVMGVVVQLLAGGKVVQIITGLNFTMITIFLAITALLYSGIRGIRASIRTDFIQMVLMILAVIVTSGIIILRGTPMDWGGINNVSTAFFSEQNWKYFLAFGLTTTFVLMCGPVGDQHYWQRAFSMKKENIIRSFILAAILFAIIPLGIAVIGFGAAGDGFSAIDNSMVGLEYIYQTMSPIIIILFLLCIIAGLSSTLDSAICSAGSIFSKFSKNRNTLFYARLGMVLITAIGMLIVNIPGLQIFWLFLFYGVLRSGVFIPTVWTMLTKKRPSEWSIFYGMLGAFLIGVPIYSLGRIISSNIITILGTLLTFSIPLFTILIDKKLRRSV